MATSAADQGAIARRLDLRTLRSAGLSVAVVTIVVFLLLFGQKLLGLDRSGVDTFLMTVRESPWAFFAVAILFTSLALTGFPQALLFAGTVAVFGGPLGALYAWVATMVSGAVTFGLGRLFGARWVRKLSGQRLQTMISLMQRRGLLASMVVRWTPSAPFIVVNAVCGASGMQYWKFAVGTGIGIVPKLLIIAFFTQQLDELVIFFRSGDPQALVAIAFIAAGWLAFMLFCRWLFRRLKSTELSGLAPETSVGFSETEQTNEIADSLNKKSSEI